MAKKLITAGAASMAMLLIVLISLVVSGSGSSSGQDAMPLGRTSAARVGQLGPGQALTSSYELFRDQVVVDKLSVPARHSKTRHTFKTSFEKEMQRMLGLGAGDVFVTSINRTDDHHALIKFNVKVSNGREAHRVSTKLGKWKMGQLGSNEPAGKRWFYEIASSSGNQVQDLEVVDVESHGTNKDSKGVCHSVRPPPSPARTRPSSCGHLRTCCRRDAHPSCAAGELRTSLFVRAVRGGSRIRVRVSFWLRA